MDPKAVDQFLKNKVQDLKEEKRQEELMALILAMGSSISDEIKSAIETIKINIPDIIIPEVKIPDITVTVPTINVPEVKIPTINVPKPEVTITIPEKDMVETNKLLKAILDKEQKDETMDISVRLKIV